MGRSIEIHLGASSDIAGVSRGGRQSPAVDVDDELGLGAVGVIDRRHIGIRRKGGTGTDDRANGISSALPSRRTRTRWPDASDSKKRSRVVASMYTRVQSMTSISGVPWMTAAPGTTHERQTIPLTGAVSSSRDNRATRACSAAYFASISPIAATSAPSSLWRLVRRISISSRR